MKLNELIEELKEKTILLFGKSRAFSSEEFQSQMEFHKIGITKEYSEEIEFCVDGKMMTPYEQNLSDELYENKKIKAINIDVLEKELAKYIDEDTLLMSLKLSHDKQRLKSFLQNSAISDALFLRLLKLYSFKGEDFFENDENRDVTAALIVRFYENIERNHNVQYATLGLMHLLSQTNDEKLIEAVASLEPLQKHFDEDSNRANYKIIATIATNLASSKSVLKQLIKKSDIYIRTLIAMRKDIDEAMQKRLFQFSEMEVLKSLAHNSNLCPDIFQELVEDENYAKIIAKSIHLDENVFDTLKEKYSHELALNETLTPQMQESLVSVHNQDVNIALASNTHLDEHIISELIYEGSEEINFAIYSNSITRQESLEEAYNDPRNHVALSHNTNTPKDILVHLANSENPKVLKGLAQNESTPVAVLYQLQLDRTLERAVKENPAFAKHIQTENIGWDR